MLDIIKNLIDIADKTEDFDTREAILEQIKDLVYKLASTINAPSNWRDIAEELAEEYKDNHDIYEALRLWDFQTED